MDATLYHNIIGALQYVTLIQPDISFVVDKAYQFMDNPTNVHWLVVKRILYNLKDAPSFGLQKSHSPDIQGYIDAYWAFYLDDRKSTNGYYIFIGPYLISYSSTKRGLSIKVMTNLNIMA